jgi:hypothetical protein
VVYFRQVRTSSVRKSDLETFLCATKTDPPIFRSSPRGVSTLAGLPRMYAFLHRKSNSRTQMRSPSPCGSTRTILPRALGGVAFEALHIWLVPESNRPSRPPTNPKSPLGMPWNMEKCICFSNLTASNSTHCFSFFFGSNRTAGGKKCVNTALFAINREFFS